MDKNLYDLEPEEAAKVPHPCASLDEALDHLDRDREFLTAAACSPTTCSTATSR
jgi:glutamine synthetase